MELCDLLDWLEQWSTGELNRGVACSIGESDSMSIDESILSSITKFWSKETLLRVKSGNLEKIIRELVHVNIDSEIRRIYSYLLLKQTLPITSSISLS